MSLINFKEGWPYLLAVGVIFWIQWLIKAKAKTDTKLEQVLQDQEQEQKQEEAHDQNMETMYQDNADWNAYIDSLDFSKLSDAELFQLRQGKRLDEPLNRRPPNTKINGSSSS